MKSCPSCQSDQVKKTSLIYAEGVGVAAGVGIGVGGIGVGGGASTSALAIKCAPPKEAKTIPFRVGILMIVYIVPLLIAQTGLKSISELSAFWMTWAVIGFVVVGVYYGKSRTVLENAHKLALAEYDKSFMCLRCGAFYKPFE